jgi:translocation and assembly module TamB
MASLLVKVLAIALGLLVLVSGLLVTFLNMEPGRLTLAEAVTLLSDGEIVVAGLSGRFPGNLGAERLEVRDPRGTWLTLERVALDWSPSKLIFRRLWIDTLRFENGLLERLPEYPPDPEQTDWPSGLGMHIGVLQVPHLELGASVTGSGASLQVEASGRIEGPERGAINLSIQRLDREGRYQGSAQLQPDDWQIDLSLDEPHGGLLAGWAGWTDLPSWSGQARLNGPPGSAATSIQLHAGTLTAAASGTIDLSLGIVNMGLTATSPDLSWRPGYSWHSAVLTGKVAGPYAHPSVDASLQIDGLRAGDTQCDRLATKISGNPGGSAHIDGKVEGLRIPGPDPKLFSGTPVAVAADLELALKDVPTSLSVSHPLLTIRGRGVAAGDSPHGDFELNLPDVRPFAALGGIDARGPALLKLSASGQGQEGLLDADATIRMIGGDPRLVALLGEPAKIHARASMRPAELKIERLAIDAVQFQFSSNGRYAGDALVADWSLSLPNLQALTGSLNGKAAATGRLTGSLDALSLVATLSGEASSRVLSGGPFKGEVSLAGLPAAPNGSLALTARVAGSNLDLATKFSRHRDGEATIALQSANWRSVRAQGAWSRSLPTGWPLGRIELNIGRLDDLSAIARIPLGGTASANVTTTGHGLDRHADFQIRGSGVGVGGLRAAGLQTSGRIADGGRGLQLEGNLEIAGYAANGIGGDASLRYQGPLNALELRLKGTASGEGTDTIGVDGEATLDNAKSRLAVRQFRARWQNETLRLKAPTQISFADVIRMDRLILGLRDGEFRVSGALSPAFELEGRIDRLPIDLGAVRYPALKDARGSVGAVFHLQGPYDALKGDVRISLTGLQLAETLNSGLPPAEARAELLLADGVGKLDARLRAGPLVAVSLRGSLPASAAERWDLTGDGRINLRVLDPWLTPDGQRAQGALSLRSRLLGPLGDPRVTGDLRLENAVLQDLGHGFRISDITAHAQLDGGTLHLTRFDGRMAPGRLSAVGKIALGQSGYPLELKITARNARPLSGERLNVTLNSDIELRKSGTTDFMLTGLVTVLRADIRIPERMPARIAILDVRKPGAPSQPPPEVQPAMGLNLTIDAPAEIFVRGRGVDAELSGKVRVTGTMSDPNPDGAFVMRRGEYRLAGRTLSFSKGEVGFDGGTLTDPSLDFVASTTSSNITATLAVGGTASKPKISLSSAPELPQDEILAHLLFGRNAASLGPLELAEIAAAVASLTGVGGNLANPLDLLRKGIGLDRLSMGSDKAGPTLEAGRYIAPGIYLGAKQGFTGATPSAALQVDVTKGLKVEGTVGTGSPTASQSGTTSVGVIYQYEY